MSSEIEEINELILIQETRAEKIYDMLTEKKKKELLCNHLIKNIVFFDDANKIEQEKECVLKEIDDDFLGKLYSVKEFIENKLQKY